MASTWWKAALMLLLLLPPLPPTLLTSATPIPVQILPNIHLPLPMLLRATPHHTRYGKVGREITLASLIILVIQIVSTNTSYGLASSESCWCQKELTLDPKSRLTIQIIIGWILIRNVCVERVVVGSRIVAREGRDNLFTWVRTRETWLLCLSLSIAIMAKMLGYRKQLWVFFFENKK